MRSRFVRGMGLVGLLWAIAAGAHAQNPDVRNIQPFVMLVVDTSGSMEELPNCLCNSSTDCSNCTPQCNLVNVFSEPPKDASGHELKKNRWATTLEALTGKFVDFQCNPLDRTGPNGMTYDLNYNVRYNQPWKCSSGTVCAYPGTTSQEKNGILDTYRDTLQFGLMTFDGDYTYKGAPQLITSDDFQVPLSEGIEGMWSTGGYKDVFYPGCSQTYVVDSGARSEEATEGGLISLGSAKCPSPPCDVYELNDAIQSSLLRTRPYGGTPISASLDDLYSHLEDEVTDPFKTCRKRYGLLITDGTPDPDFRDLNCDCGKNGKPACPTSAAYECPYPLAEDAAKKLVQGAGASDPKQLDRLFVLGMSVNDTAARNRLNAIALNGGNAQLADGNYALFADSPAVMRASLDSVFSNLLTPTSRSVPAFATGISGTQYQIGTGFRVSAEAKVGSLAPPWVGVIERKRYLCDSGSLNTPTLDANSTTGDFFANTLNNQALGTRNLWTALPVSTFTPSVLTGQLTRGEASARCGATYCADTKLNSSAITQQLLNVSNATERNTALDWMYGVAGSIRAGRRLGDIFHSSPTVVSSRLVDEPGDDAYTRFKDTAVVKERPLVLYVGSNDGILHAFSVEDYPVTGYPLTAHTGTTYKAGQEIWGFVPPAFVGRLNSSLSAHQLMMDGTPVVKDVYFQREAVATDTNYHTVLISGMRGGGNAYVALDVTDPVAPKFLWQFTDAEMGLTYGQAEIVQAKLQWPTTVGASTTTLQTRAVAILPGGVGAKKSSLITPGCIFDVTNSMRKSGSAYSSRREKTGGDPAPHRDGVQCWEKTGRALYFVDVETGRLIKKIYDDDLLASNGITLPSPIVGSPTAYQDSVGTLATRGFVVDADGVLWRFDMSAEDPKPTDPLSGWTMRPFHDLFFDRGKADGQTSYERPILSLDEERNVVVLIGTGNTDNFEDTTASNRVVSLTELANVEDPNAPEHYDALINWEIRNEGPYGKGFVPSELVTGSMALFEGQLFIATFISDASTGDSCDFGRGRIWSVDYLARDPAHQNAQYDGTGTPKTFAPVLRNVAQGSDNADAALINTTKDLARKNLLIQGLGATQRLTCTTNDDALLDSYFSPNLPKITQSAPPAIWIVAQASQDSAPAGGSQLGGVGARVDRGTTFSRMTSWASSVD